MFNAIGCDASLPSLLPVPQGDPWRNRSCHSQRSRRMVRIRITKVLNIPLRKDRLYVRYTWSFLAIIKRGSQWPDSLFSLLVLPSFFLIKKRGIEVYDKCFYLVTLTCFIWDYHRSSFRCVPADTNLISAINGLTVLTNRVYADLTRSHQIYDDVFQRYWRDTP